MADVVDGAGSAGDPLRVDRCPDCGYLLRGLPRAGVCPECGFAYDAAMIVLYGWEKGRGRRGAGRRVGGLWPYAWIGVLAMFPALEGMGAAAWLASPWGTVLLLAALVPVCVSLWRRRRSSVEGPAPLQLRMTPEGFALREGIGPVRLRPWRAAMGVGFDSLGEGRQLLYSEYNGRRVAWWDGLEVVCDEHAARRVRGRVARWCAQVGESGTAESPQRRAC